LVRRAPAKAVSCCSELAPDVAFIDRSVRGMDGIEAIREIGQGGSKSKVILLLAESDPAGLVIGAVRAGARACLLRDTSANDLKATARLVHEGKVVIHATLMAAVAESVAPWRKPLPELTEPEARLLQKLADGATNKQIAEYLGLSVDEVKRELDRIFIKLHLDGRPS
jgi:DNA-binding NarL/FixJ family response regulator